MSDDLVKRLRAFASPDAELLDDGYRLTKMCHQSHEAADRIEELEAQLSEKMDEDAYIGELEFQLTNALEAYGRLKELEAKLAVAIEAVDNAATLVENWHVIYMTAKGRNPKNYILDLSLIAEELRLASTKLKGEQV